MYTLSVKRDFVAQHFLIGGDWGPENDTHSHHYVVALQLEGRTLDQHNYLVDIVDVETILDQLVIYFKDKTLNELPEFAQTNPSVERFAQIVCRAVADRLDAPNITAMTVKIWENEIAWAAYRLELSDR